MWQRLVFFLSGLVFLLPFLFTFLTKARKDNLLGNSLGPNRTQPHYDTVVIPCPGIITTLPPFLNPLRLSPCFQSAASLLFPLLYFPDLGSVGGVSVEISYCGWEDSDP